ncbi:MAG TPA: PfkB family carbohydrate kinase [Streptosporangiaceae bacterium]|nr:PfkB family carbohydrate kinase [Streptosporangiaceae bacterium]
MLLVLGDVMTDIYVQGQVERISPDAPVPVLRLSHRTRRMSGACISAQAAYDVSGSAVTLAGVTGADEQAEFLRTSLSDAGVRSRLAAFPGYPTITKTRFLTGTHHLLRVDEDSRFHDLAPAVEEHMFGIWHSMRASVSAVLFSDYAKGALTETLIRQVVADARERRIPVVVDSKRRDMSCYRGAQAWTPNDHELALVSGHEDLQAGASRMRSRLQLDALIVTCAAEGAVVTTDDGIQAFTPPPMHQVRSVAGAGDVFAGVMTAMVAQGLDWAQATQAGVAHATRYVSHDPAEPRKEPSDNDSRAWR